MKTLATISRIVKVLFIIAGLATILVTCVYGIQYANQYEPKHLQLIFMIVGGLFIGGLEATTIYLLYFKRAVQPIAVLDDSYIRMAESN